MKFVYPLLALLLLSSCYTHKPRFTFDPADTPPAPNYAELNNWAAHPAKPDSADRSPSPTDPERQDQTAVDVFFLYPTTLTGNKRGEAHWNGDVHNQKLNTKTDASTILFQASAFNSAGRVFAPRYRQAHIYCFFTPDKKSGQEALDTAYADVEAAFEYYLKSENQGRPFILAGHSQGARHAMFLLRDRIENTPLEKQLVAAYILGWPVKNDFFQNIKPCEHPEQTDCYCSWRTWERKHGLKYAFETSVICTNPLNWSTQEDVYVPKTQNEGTILRKFGEVYPQLVDAQVHKGVLLATKPKFPGSVFFVRKNYHIADVNLYYFNLRHNARLRVENFVKEHPSGN